MTSHITGFSTPVKLFLEFQKRKPSVILGALVFHEAPCGKLIDAFKNKGRSDSVINANLHWERSCMVRLVFALKHSLILKPVSKERARCLMHRCLDHLWLEGAVGSSRRTSHTLTLLLAMQPHTDTRTLMSGAHTH